MQVITYQSGQCIVQQLTEHKCEEHMLHRKVFTLTENKSTDTPLEIIEVQSGSYLGEDDIVRFEDTYGRAQT